MGFFTFLRSSSSRSLPQSSHSQATSTTEKFPFYDSPEEEMPSFNVAAVQEPTKCTTDRQTGFPEPLSPDRNTTLPHPSADTSPNATIIAPDVNPRLSHHRSRSFLSRKSSHRSNHKVNRSQEIKNGTVTALPMPANGEQGLYDGIMYEDGSREEGKGSGSLHSGEKSRGSDEGIQRRESDKLVGKSEGSVGSSDEGSGQKEEPKRGLLRKLRHH